MQSQNPTWTPIAVTVNPATPSHSATLPHATYHMQHTTHQYHQYPFPTLMRHIRTILHPKAPTFRTICTLSCDMHMQRHQHHLSMAIFRRQCNPQCLIRLTQMNRHHPRVQIKFNIGQVHFSTQNFIFYKPILINLKCNEKYNKVKLEKKKKSGKNLNVLTKSLSVETRNSTKSHVTNA